MSTKTELYRSILKNMGVDLDTLPDNLTSTLLTFIAENCSDQPEDGFSPVVEMKQTENGATISITDKNGTNAVTITHGKDGVSATHSWKGTTLTITSASGTSSVDLKGEKGDKGDSYILTDTDKNNIASIVHGMIGNGNEVSY